LAETKTLSGCALPHGILSLCLRHQHLQECKQKQKLGFGLRRLARHPIHGTGGRASGSRRPWLSHPGGIHGGWVSTRSRHLGHRAFSGCADTNGLVISNAGLHHALQQFFQDLCDLLWVTALKRL
jgi:hypothetical protein